MNDVWFTADSHYGHEGIIEACNRPYASVEEMDEDLIAKWNAVVKPGDLVYHLGDFAISSGPEPIEKIVRRLQGSIHWIWGNHDHKTNRKAEGFAWKDWYKQIRIPGATPDEGWVHANLFHYALRTWQGMYDGAWQLHGHSHGGLKKLPGNLQIDVGVDSWGYAPVALETLRAEMKRIREEEELTEEWRG